MATISAPFTHGQTETDLGYDYIFAQKEIQQSFKDRWDPLSMGLASLWGDVSGSGSDTLRVTYMDGVGLDVAMDALANENSPITNKSVVVGYSTLTTALYGIGYSDTYVQQAYSREPAMSLDALKAKAPGNWVATMRGLACNIGAGFAANTVGTTGSDLTIDDMIDLQTIFSEKVGSAERGTPIVTLAPQQVTQLRASAAANAAYKNSIAEFASVIGYGAVRDGEQPNFLGLGYALSQTDGVVQSGGAYRGFAISPGAIGWGRASTVNIKTANPAGTMYMPQYGLIVEEITAGSRVATREWQARALIGMAAATGGDYHVQVAVLSQTA